MHLNDIFIKIYKTALYLAVENENIEIITLLLANENININYKISNLSFSSHLSTKY